MWNTALLAACGTTTIPSDATASHLDSRPVTHSVSHTGAHSADEATPTNILLLMIDDIGLDKIKFVTVPWELDPIDPNRVVWREPEAAELWEKVKYDKPLTKDQSEGAITAAKPTKPKASDNDPNVTGLCS